MAFPYPSFTAIASACHMASFPSVSITVTLKLHPQFTIYLSTSYSVDKVLGKCQLQEVVQEKEGGLDSSETIRTEFADCTIITVAHRIPTVMDCTKVLAISDDKLHINYPMPHHSH
ncbi:putative ABC transporter C family member 10-like [Sesbania bispinosa]|nr:putative ABC transporter C family member 10-like [Sesbania bispinosa]